MTEQLLPRSDRNEDRQLKSKMADAESTKRTVDPNFKPGVMSPGAKQAFLEMNSNFRAACRQKIILDEDRFEQRFLHCNSCKERFDMDQRSPRLLPCHHAFCYSCIMAFYNREVAYRQSLTTLATVTYAVSIECPTCKASFISSEDGLRQLVRDHRIIQLMDFVGVTDKQTVTYCSKHSLQPLNFFCEACKSTICRDCTVIDHKVCSEGKLVIDIPTAVQKYKPVLEKGLEDMTKEAEVLRERKDDCTKLLSGCKDEDGALVKEIKTSFDAIRKALTERETELIEMAETYAGKGKKHVQLKIDTFNEKEKEISDIITCIKSTQTDSKVTEMFEIYERLNGYKSEPAFDKEELSDNSKVGASFRSRDESSIISRISNYGDIQTTQDHSKPYSSTNGASSSSSYTSALGTYSTGGTSRYGTSSYTSAYTSSSRYAPRSYKY